MILQRLRRPSLREYRVHKILEKYCLKMSPWTNFCKFLEFKNRSASHVQEVVAFVVHARIPDFGIGFPGVTGELVGIRRCHRISSGKLKLDTKTVLP